MDPSDTDVPTLPASLPSTLEVIGIIAAIIPFVFSMASSSTSTVNGEIVSASYSDPAAIAGGIVAAACGALSLATQLARTDPASKAKRAILCIALLAIGAYHALRGFGVVGV